jgi:hypothetical protein
MPGTTAMGICLNRARETIRRTGKVEGEL